MEGKLKIKLSLCLTNHIMKKYPLLNEASQHGDIWGSGSVALHIFNLGTRQRWVVRFIP